MKLVKTAAIALVVVAATAGAASAAQYAWADHDANVRLFHKNMSPSVNFIAEGQKVKIVGAFGNWYKVQVPGQDGWVKANALDFAPSYNNADYDTSFCVGGVNGSFCLNANY